MTVPQQVRRGLVHVLNNYLHHGSGEPIHGPVDPFSSASHFDGWRYELPPYVLRDAGDPVCPPARTWLLSVGWQRYGKLLFTERPA